MEYLTLFRSESDAISFGTYVLNLRKLDRWTWACYVNKKNYPDLEVGDTITLTYPRLGMNAGKNFIIKRIKRDSNALFDELTLFGPGGIDATTISATATVSLAPAVGTGAGLLAIKALATPTLAPATTTSAGTLASSSFAVLDSAGSSFSTSRNARNSEGILFSTSGTVLSSAGSSYNPI